MTSVGATRLYPDQTINDPESAMQVNLTAFNIQTGSGPTSAPYDFFASRKYYKQVGSSRTSKING